MVGHRIGAQTIATKAALSLVAAVVLLGVSAAPAGSRTRKGPRCGDFKVVGDHPVLVSGNTLQPVKGATRLTFLCSAMKKVTRAFLYVKLITPSGYPSGGKFGDPTTDPTLTGGNPSDAVPGGPSTVNGNPPADCLWSSASPRSHTDTCGISPPWGHYTNGTYALFWTNTDATGNEVSSCGLALDDVTVYLVRPGPIDVDIGSAKKVIAGCHTAGPTTRGEQKSMQLKLLKEAEAKEISAKVDVKSESEGPYGEHRFLQATQRIRQDLSRAEKLLAEAAALDPYQMSTSVLHEITQAADGDREAGVIVAISAGHAQSGEGGIAQRRLKGAIFWLDQAERMKSQAIVTLLSTGS